MRLEADKAFDIGDEWLRNQRMMLRRTTLLRTTRSGQCAQYNALRTRARRSGPSNGLIASLIEGYGRTPTTARTGWCGCQRERGRRQRERYRETGFPLRRRIRNTNIRGIRCIFRRT